jgi:uncharacterized caspase-like protein
LAIENGHYPDADAPLIQTINDARALTAALRRDGFEVDIVEDPSSDDMHRAIDRLKSKIRPDSVVMLFFGGYGIQVGRESYIIPVDAAIWKESDVRREGLSIEAVLGVMKEQAPAPSWSSSTHRGAIRTNAGSARSPAVWRRSTCPTTR